eukprot:3861693-Amphidinium_carterae.2
MATHWPILVDAGQAGAKSSANTNDSMQKQPMALCSWCCRRQSSLHKRQLEKSPFLSTRYGVPSCVGLPPTGAAKATLCIAGRLPPQNSWICHGSGGRHKDAPAQTAADVEAYAALRAFH